MGYIENAKFWFKHQRKNGESTKQKLSWMNQLEQEHILSNYTILTNQYSLLFF